MENGYIDIVSLNNIALNLDLHSDEALEGEYSKYNVYLENRTDEDIPEESIYNLYSIFTDALNHLANDNYQITISEKILSTRQMYGTTNYETIVSSQFSKVDDDIEYDDINDFVKKLDMTKSYDEITSQIWLWASDILGLNLSLNENPENSDDSNLVIPHLLKNDIKDITESILSKFFRNILQLIRVIHDYRLYGMNSTILCGAASSLNSQEKMGTWSSLPSSVWMEYRGSYMVGKTAYNESTKGVGDYNGIENYKYNISPYTSYGIKPHVHEVAVNISGLPGSISFAKKYYSKWNWQHKDDASHIDDPTMLSAKWRDLAKANLNDGADSPAGFVVTENKKDGSIKGTIKYSYSWNSNGYCKLVTPKGSSTDSIFKKSKTVLPTYETYVWKWIGYDDTNIKEPRKYIG